MRQRVEHRFARALEEVRKRWVAGQIAAQDECVEKEADEAFRFHARTTGDGRTDCNVMLPRVAMEQRLKCREQQHEQRRAFATA